MIEDLDRLEAETDSSSELGVFVQSDDVFDDETVAFVDEFAKRSARRIRRGAHSRRASSRP